LDGAEFVVSGNGRVAFAAGSEGLRRIDVQTGTTTELIPATPLVTAIYRVLPPETRVAPPGAVISLAGVAVASVQRVLFCGSPVETVSQFGMLRFQVPRDQPEGPCELVLESASPFEHAPLALEVRQYDPLFHGVVLHEGFTGIVTESSPASPGEAITVYMSGLGPVDERGRVDGGFGCTFNFTDAAVEYAGAAPAFTGFYQVNVRVPPVRGVAAFLSCGFDTQNRATTTVWLGP
jgi:uncharacterized protein (TIGR03437 family)